MVHDRVLIKFSFKEMVLEMENTRFMTTMLIYNYSYVWCIRQETVVRTLVMIGDIGEPKWSMTTIRIGGIGYAVLLLAWPH